MKIAAYIQDIQPLEDQDLYVGSLVASKTDPGARGLVVEFVARDVVTVLWSTPPKGMSKTDHRGIW